jgi:hypothetical protein
MAKIVSLLHAGISDHIEVLFQYKAKQPDAWLARLKIAVRKVSRDHQEFGYPKITHPHQRLGMTGSFLSSDATAAVSM